ncbi:hypothetical protein BH708_12150 [Brachybacterium sp. P6-10-X1]|uniref:hypothetical protein n=1 Tax=Brachybacterium sp. P6-10-X1 TaxID=1903186 RepID=UPI000971A9EA|nr:hypothetical protein [Brachybacterium sp. P6-10-X1]APX33341.1 hypothetical protein BH708_12150 [Brachybacterium sp. P6-10-X1]
MHASDEDRRARSAARATERVPLSLHLVASALAALGVLAMLAALPLPSDLDTGIGVLLIAGATLVVAGAVRRHGRTGVRALSFDLPSAAMLGLAIVWSLMVLLVPDDSPIALRTLVGLGFGVAFLLVLRWEDRGLVRRVSRRRSLGPRA